MLEIKVLSLIVNELANLTIRRDRNYYRLQLTIKTKELNNLNLHYFINYLMVNDKNLFNYDNSNERYYVYGSKVIDLLELIYTKQYLFSKNLYNKITKILNNKELFTRSSGKKYTKEELIRLEQLHKEINE